MSNKTLYIVATPIGNLSDLSDRARDVLSRVSAIGAEDTRVTKKLLGSFGSKTKLVSVHEHSEESVLTAFLEIDGDLAYVSDAGTPGISDPGGKVVALARKMGITVIGIPGASALTTALSVAGFPTNRFTFLGFPPQKNGRKTYFAEVAKLEETVAFFESKHRIEKTLAELQPDRYCYLARELTKMHETHYFGTVTEVMNQLTATSQKGEYVVVLAPLNWHL